MLPYFPRQQDNEELSSFHSSLGTWMRAWPHELVNQPVGGCGTIAIRPYLWRIWNQTCLGKTHDTRMCWIDSSTWSHKGQAAGCGNPLLSRRSAVQHLLMASQINSLQCLGSQVPRILQGVNLIAPIKKASYADLHEYNPDRVNRQRCWSGNSCWRCSPFT